MRAAAIPQGMVAMNTNMISAASMSPRNSQKPETTSQITLRRVFMMVTFFQIVLRGQIPRGYWAIANREGFSAPFVCRIQRDRCHGAPETTFPRS